MWPWNLNFMFRQRFPDAAHGFNTSFRTSPANIAVAQL
jgi:hypothetical protein